MLTPILCYSLCLVPHFGATTRVAQPKADYPALEQRFQRGNYAEARAGYEALLKEEKPAIAAFAGLSAVHRAEGEYPKALETLDAGLKAHPDDAALLALRADLHYSLGRWDDAVRDAEAAIKKQDANFLARWVRTRILRDRGDVAAADREVRWFVKAYSDAGAAGKDITDPKLLLVVAHAGVENARWNNKPQQFKFILDEVLGDAIKADPDFWQAEVRTRLSERNHTLKRALTDPTILSGIGNAYSDEILHRARLSPMTQTKSLDDEEWQRLYEATRATLTEWTARLREESLDGFPEKVTAFRDDMAVHGRFGKPCPVCGSAVQRIRYADNETNYCPRCQTNGKLLADRALSRLLKSDWPKTVEEWESGKKR